MKLSVVVLAGGEGRRIGGKKPQRLLAGKALVEHVFERVGEWGMPAAVAVGLEAEGRTIAGFATLRDDARIGPIGGILSALRWARDEGFGGVLTVPCDTPFLPSDLPARLEAPIDDGARAAIGRSNGRTHPSCGVWTRECLADLERYLPDARSLTGFAQQVSAAIVDWPLDRYDPFFNVNTPEDLARAEELLRTR